jgi:hypothetical protein
MMRLLMHPLKVVYCKSSVPAPTEFRYIVTAFVPEPSATDQMRDGFNWNQVLLIEGR